MDTRRYLTLVAVVVPPLFVAALGLTHPPRLTVEDADHWQMMHTVLLPVFPLLALGPWLVAREVSRIGGVLVGIVAFTYACFYTALDILAGIGGGALKAVEAGGLGIIMPLAGDLGEIGSYAYLIATALAGGLAASRAGWLRTLPGTALALAGGWLFWQHHIFPPEGVWAQVLIAAGFGWLAAVVTDPSAQAAERTRQLVA